MRNRYSWHLLESKNFAGATGIYWLQLRMAVMVTWQPGGFIFAHFHQLNACWLNTHSVTSIVTSLTSVLLSAVPCFPVLNMMHEKKKTKNWQTDSSTVSGNRASCLFLACLTVFKKSDVVFTMNSTNQIPFTPVLLHRWISQNLNE